MILKSKLSNKYPEADPAKWLTGDKDNLDPVFAGRLAAIAKEYNVKLSITAGFRSPEKQKELYAQYKAGKLKSCAVPGTSYHEISLAVDTSTQPIRNMNNVQLAKYGICKPLASEGWHLEPIEFINTGSKANIPAVKILSPTDLSSQLKSKFALSDGTIAYLEKYKFAEALFEGLLAGKKDFSDDTIAYIKGYEFGEELIRKLGIV